MIKSYLKYQNYANYRYYFESVPIICMLLTNQTDCQMCVNI
nr:MAG TPA: hypothetical protein [Crassvirales sp.]